MQRISVNEKGPYIAVNRSEDPTRSQTLRREYERALTSHLRELKAKIREGIIERGSLDMSLNQPMPVFRFETDQAALDHFDDWLQSEINQGYLRTVSSQNNEYIRSAYSKGVTHADVNIRQMGEDFPDESVEAVLNKPIHRSKVEQLFSRNFELLGGVTTDMADEMRDTLSHGLASGHGPRRVARDLNDRVAKIGEHRSQLIARSEIINAHSEATLERYKELGVEHVTIQAEILTAGDDRVCPLCDAFEGIVETPAEVQTGIRSLGEVVEDVTRFPEHLRIQDFPKKPPFHPQCRCAIIPVTPAT